MNYVLASATHVGKRDGNEDDCFVAARDGVALAGAEMLDRSSTFDLVAIVADGMGGGAYGEAASQIAVETVRKLFAEGTYVEWAEQRNLGFVVNDYLGLLREVVRDIHKSIAQEATRRRVGKMGSTAVILLAKENQYWFAHVGDSRLYHQTGSGKISQCTEDHNMAAHGGKASQVYKILGCDSPHPDLGTGTISEGDIFFLCTDGIALAQPTLQDVFSDVGMKPDEACQSLVDQGVHQGGEVADNATCIVIKADSNYPVDLSVKTSPPVASCPKVALAEHPVVQKDRRASGVWFFVVALVCYGLGIATSSVFLNGNQDLATEGDIALLIPNTPPVSIPWDIRIQTADSLDVLRMMENDVPAEFRALFNGKLSELRVVKGKVVEPQIRMNHQDRSHQR